MIRAVLDTNVLASGFATAGTPPDALLRLWLAGVFVLIYSDHVIDELRRTLQRPYFRARLAPQQRINNLGLITTFGVWTPLTSPVHGAATHPEDDLILSTAVSGRAGCLVTGDVRLLRRVPTYQDVRLLSPRAFLNLIDDQTAT